MDREAPLDTKGIYDKALAALEEAERLGRRYYSAGMQDRNYDPQRAGVQATIGLGYATLFAARKPTS